MLNLNRATLIGHVGRDPEIRHTQAGDPVAHFSLATTETWRRGETRESHTEWHRVTAFGPLAELVAARVRRGAALYVEGRIRHREYTDRDGNARTAHEIHLAGPRAQLNILAGGAEAAGEAAGETSGTGDTGQGDGTGETTGGEGAGQETGA